MRRGTDARVDGGEALGRCLPSGPSFCSLDVHRCCRHPELELHPGYSFKARPAQSMQFLGETEGTFDSDLAFSQPTFPQRAGGAFFGRLNQVLHELAMQRAGPARWGTLCTERASLADTRWCLVADTVGRLHPSRSVETFTRRAHIDVLVSKPLEVLGAPDAGVGMAEAGRWDEGCDAGVF